MIFCQIINKIMMVVFDLCGFLNLGWCVNTEAATQPAI
jgi:hypothetical protein